MMSGTTLALSEALSLTVIHKNARLISKVGSMQIMNILP